MRYLEILSIGVYVYQLSGSPFTVAMVLFLRMLPAFLFGAFAGALVERLDRQRFLVLGLTGLSIMSAVLGLLVASDLIRIWHVALGMFLSGLLWATDHPVRRAMLGEIAGLDRLGAATGLDSTTINAMRMVGPLVGGTLLATIGMHGAYFLGMVLYGLAALLIGAVHFRSLPRSATGNLIANVRIGLGYIRSRPLIVGTLAYTIIMNMFAFPYTSMLPVIAKSDLGLGAFLAGVLMSMEGAGAFLGALFVAWRATPTWFTRLYVGGSLLCLAGILTFALSGRFEMAFLALFAGGLGFAGFGAMQGTIVFAATPPEYRQRVLGVLAVCIGSGPIGILFMGTLAHSLGAATAVAISSSLGIGLAVVVLVFWPALRRGEDPRRTAEMGS